MRRRLVPSFKNAAFAAAVANAILVCCLVLMIADNPEDFRSASVSQRREATIIALQQEVSRLRREADNGHAHVPAVRPDTKMPPTALSFYLENEMAQKLKPFSGTWFDVSIDPRPGPEALAVQITDVLRFSGWQASVDPRVDGSRNNIRLANGVVARAITGLSGLNVAVTGTRKAAWQAAADVLCGELKKVVPAATCSPNNATPQGDYVVHVSVGS